MGIGVSLLLIAAGAILTWGVTGTVQGLDITAIGVIVMVVGVVGLVLTMIFWQSWWGPAYFRRRSYGPWGGRTYVEEEEGPRPY